MNVKHYHADIVFIHLCKISDNRLSKEVENQAYHFTHNLTGLTCIHTLRHTPHQPSIQVRKAYFKDYVQFKTNQFSKHNLRDNLIREVQTSRIKDVKTSDKNIDLVA